MKRRGRGYGEGRHYPARGRGTVAALVLLLALVAGLAWWGGRWWPDGRSSVQLLPWQPAAVLPASSSGQAVASEPPNPDRAPAAPQPPSVWQLCGIGAMPVPPGLATSSPGQLPAPPDHLGKPALDAARERTLAALQAGPPRGRLAALLWGAMDETRTPPPAEWRSAVLAAARASNDAAALRWALPACDGKEACERTLMQDAVRLEPANASHWAMLMRYAADRDAALQGLLRSERWTTGFGTLTAVTQAAVPPDVPEYLRLMMLMETTGIEAAMVDSLQAATTYCSPQHAAPATRRADCNRIAHLLVERSDTMLALTVGAGLAQSAGWPAERLASLKEEQRTLQQAALSNDIFSSPQPLGCEAVERTRKRFDAIGKVGELQALRDESTARPPR